MWSTDGSLRLEHYANILHGVPDAITKTEPGRVVGGRDIETTQSVPPASSEKHCTAGDYPEIPIYIRRRELHVGMRSPNKRVNISENVVHGTGDTTHVIADIFYL